MFVKSNASECDVMTHSICLVGHAWEGYGPSLLLIHDAGQGCLGLCVNANNPYVILPPTQCVKAFTCNLSTAKYQDPAYRII